MSDNDFNDFQPNIQSTDILQVNLRTNSVDFKIPCIQKHNVLA